MKNLGALFSLTLACAACTPATEPAPPETPSAEQPASGPAAPDERPSPIPLDAAAGPSGQDSLTWFFDNHGRNGVPRLMYSARASDEMALNLQCRQPGTVTALIVRTAPGPKPAGWPFKLISSSERIDLQGSIASAEDDLLIIEAELPASSPLLAELKSSGQLSIEDASSSSPMPLNAINEAERDEIARFLAACPS